MLQTRCSSLCWSSSLSSECLVTILILLCTRTWVISNIGSKVTISRLLLLLGDYARLRTIHWNTRIDDNLSSRFIPVCFETFQSYRKLPTVSPTILYTDLSLRKIAIWMSKNCQKLKIFFFWQFLWKNDIFGIFCCWKN